MTHSLVVTLKMALMLSYSDDKLVSFHQYVEMMGQFKEQHKTVEQLRMSGFSTGEIKKVCSF